MFYVFLADGFEETEAIATIDVMLRGGLDVKTVGVSGKSVTGSHKITVEADLTADEISFQELEGVVLPGGMPGTLNLKASKEVEKYLRYCEENNKIIGAICAAPSVLGNMGLLKGKKATCFPGYENELLGAEYTGEHTAVDGNIITAKGAGCSILFGYEIVAKAVSREKADSVLEEMQCF